MSTVCDFPYWNWVLKIGWGLNLGIKCKFGYCNWVSDVNLDNTSEFGYHT